MRVQASQDVRRLGKTFVLLLVGHHECLGVLRSANQAFKHKTSSFNLFDYVLALIFVLALQLAQTCWMTVAGNTVLGLPVSVLCKLRVLCCVLLAEPTTVCVQAKTG